MIIFDKNIPNSYFQILSSYIKNNCQLLIFFTINNGEQDKNLNTVIKIFNIIAKFNFCKNSYIIGFGGGVTLDIAGFVSSTYKRGCNLINIPTTLSSQVDAAIGSKNAINFVEKNIIGTFFDPKIVYISICFLKSLPIHIFSAGMAEVIKHACIEKKYFDWLENNYLQLLNLNSKALLYMVYYSCKIKAKIVINDKYDNKNIRCLLNLGHTFGHALEKNYNLSHGEAVSIGIVLIAKISLISKKEKERIINMLHIYNLPTKIPLNINRKNILRSILYDKKNNDNGKINLILIKKIGFCYLHKNISYDFIDNFLQNIN